MDNSENTLVSSEDFSSLLFLFSSLLFFFVVIVVVVSLHLISPASSPRLASRDDLCCLFRLVRDTHSLTHPFFFSLSSILLFPPINVQQHLHLHEFAFPPPSYMIYSCHVVTPPLYQICMYYVAPLIPFIAVYYIILINVVIH